jgi:hypothetical protein
VPAVAIEMPFAVVWQKFGVSSKWDEPNYISLGDRCSSCIVHIGSVWDGWVQNNESTSIIHFLWKFVAGQ